MLRKDFVFNNPMREFSYSSEEKLEDYDLWHRIVIENENDPVKIKFHNLGQVLTNIRKHESNRSNTLKVDDEVVLKQKHLPSFVNDPKLQQDIRENTDGLVSEYVKLTSRKQTNLQDFKKLS